MTSAQKENGFYIITNNSHYPHFYNQTQAKHCSNTRGIYFTKKISNLNDWRKLFLYLLEWDETAWNLHWQRIRDQYVGKWSTLHIPATSYKQMITCVYDSLIIYLMCRCMFIFHWVHIYLFYHYTLTTKLLEWHDIRLAVCYFLERIQDSILTDGIPCRENKLKFTGEYA